MPTGYVLHEADALALDRFRQNHQRPARTVVTGRQSFHNLIHVVPINLHDIPAEALVFLIQRIDVHDFSDWPINLKPIAVYDADQVV